MDPLPDFDQFVNWDDTEAETRFGAQTHTPPPVLVPDQEVNMGLILENDTEDGFSFSALHYFGESVMPGMGGEYGAPGFEAVPASAGAEVEVPPGTRLETPNLPCTHCTLAMHDCQMICEGRFKGYCTTCVSQGVECSLGGILSQIINPEAINMGTASMPWLGPTEASNNTFLSMDTMGVLPTVGGGGSSSSSGLPVLGTPSDGLENDQAPPSAEELPDVSPPQGPPKIGARFSRESVRILRSWLASHNTHPYPSEEEKEALQRQTGLSKTQIINWLANARRRGKIQAPQPSRPFSGSSNPMDIPRRGTPVLESMNPLQRWEHSPPEHEPASVSAIARAVNSSSGPSSGLDSPHSLNYTDDGSSASSLGTSRSSNGSMKSAHSRGSRNSWGSLGSAPFLSSANRRRRRRKAPAQPKMEGKTSLTVPLKTFQCTFCTDTFRTKHDWQRHEKSLHLSLERWVCAPDGPRARHPETGVPSCIYCGAAEPDEAHIETHNHMACQERSLEERTFYRKDHLNQHLRLVHDVKFLDWSMKPWKVLAPEIRSRCGFCGIYMDTWAYRIDHLAEHFKSGQSMADWKGDWGFETTVTDLVENSIPPYLIHHERVSPLPYAATSSSPESPRTAFELLKIELAYFITNHVEQNHRPPSDDELRLEACRIVFASELLSLSDFDSEPSWLRDLIMSDAKITRKARFGPLRGASENRLGQLKINGKDNLFQDCLMEVKLDEFVQFRQKTGLAPSNLDLQEEACKIVARGEAISLFPSDYIANWLIRLITTSSHWLAGFRQRVNLPPAVKRGSGERDGPSGGMRFAETTVHDFSGLEKELGDFVSAQRMLGVEPTDADIRRQARMALYELDDEWQRTAADNQEWLDAFRHRHPRFRRMLETRTAMAPTPNERGLDGRATNSLLDSDKDATIRVRPWFLNDSNRYRRLQRELSKWVAKTMSPNNPASHIPTDSELQYQARWIRYDEDDPWNQTAADNEEWLTRFKRDVGIVKDGGPGLGSEAMSEHARHEQS